MGLLSFLKVFGLAGIGNHDDVLFLFGFEHQPKGVRANVVGVADDFGTDPVLIKALARDARFPVMEAALGVEKMGHAAKPLRDPFFEADGGAVAVAKGGGDIVLQTVIQEFGSLVIFISKGNQANRISGGFDEAGKQIHVWFADEPGVLGSFVDFGNEGPF